VNERDQRAKESLFQQVLSEASEPFDIIFGNDAQVHDCKVLRLGNDAVVVESRGSTVLIPLHAIARVQLTRPDPHGYSL
jgi:hypothetical protein